MAIQWGSYEGSSNERLGIDIVITQSSGDWYEYEVRWYQDSQYPINDSQVLTIGGHTSAKSITFTALQGSRLVFARRFTVTKVYGGGPTNVFTGVISGHYSGATPSVSRSYTIPAKAADPPYAPVVNPVTNIDGDGGDLSWSKPGTRGAAISGYQLHVSVNSNFSGASSFTYSSSVQSIRMGGWAAGTTYYIRMRALSSAGASAWSSTVSYKTDDVPNKVGLPSVGTITGSSAATSWSAPGTNGAPVTGYDVRLSRSSTFSSGVSNYSQSGTTRTFNGLTSGTTYYMQVRADSAVGPGAWSSTRSFTTDNVPDAPAAPSLTNPTPTKISGTWPLPSGNGDAVDDYQVQIALDSAFSNVVENAYTGTSRSYTSGDLEQGEQFYFRVRAHNDVGWGGWSPSKSISTFYQDLTQYPTQTPDLTVVAGATSHRLLFRVDIKEPHPFSNGVRTVTYELSASGDFINDVTTETVTFQSNVLYGAISGESMSFSDDMEMGFGVTLPSQGQWHLRVKTGGDEGLADSSYDSEIFTSSHVPSVTITGPTQDAKVLYVGNQSFQFSVADFSPLERMSAYQIITERNDDGTLVWDSGKQPADLPKGPNGISYAIDSSEKDIALRWRIRVWDSTDTVSSWTSYSVFTLVNPPQITVTNPVDQGSITTGRPTFTWTVGLSAGRTPSSTTITVTQVDDNNTVWSRTVEGNILTVTPNSTILVNEVDYDVTIEVTDSSGITGSAVAAFQTSYVGPPPLNYTIENRVNESGYVEIDWSSTPPDSRLVAWNVYRRAFPSDEWVLVEEINNEAQNYYRDYLVQSGVTYQYTVTQTADRSGELLESPLGTVVLQSGAVEAEARHYEVISDQYWIIVPDRPELSMLLPNVTDAPDTLDFEDETFTLIGRGRHRDYGDELGFSGSITFQVRQPELQSSIREAFYALRRAKETYYLRSPFGRLIQIAIGSPQWSPLSGTGLQEMGDMTFNYEEVA